MPGANAGSSSRAPGSAEPMSGSSASCPSAKDSITTIMRFQTRPAWACAPASSISGGPSSGCSREWGSRVACLPGIAPCRRRHFVSQQIPNVGRSVGTNVGTSVGTNSFVPTHWGASSQELAGGMERSIEDRRSESDFRNSGPENSVSVRSELLKAALAPGELPKNCLKFPRGKLRQEFLALEGRSDVPGQL
jgi:hypothetical protein